ncbi:MAG: protein-L-isoaspartate(D-aspartate) O-methyltransferase [Chloroflexota bacterium]
MIIGKRPSYDIERERMVKDQLAARGISDPRVLEAMRTVPRHLFVPKEYRYLAYTDGPLPIGKRQTISQPYIVALMTEVLELGGEERVLEIGTGSGYQAAVLSLLAKEVHTIELYPELAQRASRLMEKLKYNNVHIHVSDGSQGIAEHAPFQAIVITAAAPRVPPPIKQQMDDGGRLILPVGGLYGQTLELWRRKGDQWDYETLAPVAFVPLRGQWGWNESKWLDF